MTKKKDMVKLLTWRLKCIQDRINSLKKENSASNLIGSLEKEKRVTNDILWVIENTL